MLHKFLYGEYKKRNTYLAICGILIVLNIIFTLLAYQMNISFTIHGEKFKYVSNEDNSIIFTDSDGNLIQIIKESYDNHFSPECHI